MSNDPFNKVTIIIPTYNRYSLLKRLLKFYESYDFPQNIHILDSSSDSLESDELQNLLTHKKVKI